MKKFPSIPRLVNSPSELIERGSLRIQEKVDGANFRFQLRDNGVLRFGDRSRVYTAREIPTPYRHAVRHVRDHLNRDALREITDVESTVFFGEAMHQHTISYDWSHVPSFLGFDIWSETREQFLPWETVERIYDHLDLSPVNTFDTDIRANEFDPDTYEIPRSNWYEGPAEGVIIRDEKGRRTKLLHPRFQEVDDTIPVAAPADELARKYATSHRFEKIADKLTDREIPVTFDAVYDRTLEDIIREEHKQLYYGNTNVDMKEFRSEVAALTRRFLESRVSDG
jgi:ATP-dependent RNA circularization protein (DNA/RNA ligase family)